MWNRKLARQRWEAEDITTVEKLREEIEWQDTLSGKVAVMNLQEAKELRTIATALKCKAKIALVLNFGPDPVPTAPPTEKAEMKYIEWSNGSPTKEWVMPLSEAGLPTMPKQVVTAVKVADTDKEWKQTEVTTFRMLMVKEFTPAELWKAVAETKQVDKAIAGLAKSLDTDLKAYGFKQAGDTIVGYVKVLKRPGKESGNDER